MVRKAGIDSVISEKLISLIFLIIILPTIIIAGAVAKAGMSPARGANTKARKKPKPTTTAVKPVLPPSLIPVENSKFDSTIFH